MPLGGRRVPVDKPRLRATDGSGEIRLDTWDAAQAVDLLSEHMLAAALAGVSTRNYQHTALEQVGDVAARSTRKSTVSARFVAATRARLDELRNRDLSDRRWLVVYIDGFESPADPSRSRIIRATPSAAVRCCAPDSCRRRLRREDQRTVHASSPD